MLICSYRQGDVLIFLSGHLYHQVAPWQPTKWQSGGILTPGRVGNVFFFPEISYERLKGKPKGWNWRTMSGTMPDAQK